MELDQRRLHAAHQLGEAILRFVKAVESPVPPETAHNNNENRLLRVSKV